MNPRLGRSWAAALALFVTAGAIGSMAVGCVPRSSAIALGAPRPRWEGAVRITAIEAPPDAQPVGLVQANGRGPIETIAPLLVERARDVGGDWVVVDQVVARSEIVTSTQVYSYTCGTPKAPRSCTGSRIISTEILTTTMIGRAFATQGAAR
jgi:hypothetical protein